MIKIKKIICGAIVCVLAIATAVTFVGCKEKDKGLSDAEKALRANAVVVLDKFLEHAEDVKSYINFTTEMPSNQSYLYSCDDYVDSVEIYAPVFKMLIKNDNVNLGELYEYSTTIEGMKGVLLLSVEISNDSIICNTHSHWINNETNELDGEINRWTFTFNYNGSEPISYSEHLMEQNLNYNFSRGGKYVLSTSTGKVFVSVEDYEYDYEYDYDEDIYYNFIEVKDNNELEETNYDINDFNEVGKKIFIKFLESMNERLVKVDITKSFKSVPNDINNYFDELYNED